MTEESQESKLSGEERDPSVGSADDETCSLEDLNGEKASTSCATRFQCPSCMERFQQPRVLHCLHVVCTECLEKHAAECEVQCSNGPTPVPSPPETKIVLSCPVCKQETRVALIGELPLDVVVMNMMDMDDIRAMRMLCTSCKAQEKAVARCCDCASFLCPNCVTAHKYMRCFENHKVESFEDLQKGEGVAIHKPFYCSLHPGESVKFFCRGCQIPVCSECMLCVHKMPEHACERIADVETKLVDELRGIVLETKDKISSCEAASTDLETVLSDLQQQRDNARDLIKETYQSYKAMLEKRQEELLKELDEIHSSSELSVMDMFHSVEKTVERMEDSCQFTERILEHGNGVEVLSLKKHISIQLLMLLNNIPQPEPTVKIEFHTDTDKFNTMVKIAFGQFKKHNDLQKMHDSSLQSSFDAEQFGLTTDGMSSSSLNPVSVGLISQAMASLLPGVAGLAMNPDLVGTLGMAAMQQHSTCIASSVITPGLPAVASSVTAAVEPSIAAPGLIGRTISRNSYSPMSDSGISVDAASTGSAGPVGSQAFSATLSKLIPPLTGSAQVGGLNFGGSSAAVGSRPHPLSQVPDAAALTSLLSSVTPTTPLAPGTPLGDLNGLFSATSQSTGQPLLGAAAVRDGSPIAAAVAGLLSGPPPPSSGGLSFGSIDGPGNLRSRGKVSTMQIRSKFGQLGPGKGQFNSPHGFCLGMDEDIVVADTNNHRVQIFEKTGEFKYQFGIPGREEGQLWYPRKVAVIRTSGKYVVCDRGSERSRMQLFTKNGQFIKKIAIRYIDIVAGLAITAQGHIVAVDSVSPTVFCISESGELIRWFDCSDYMREPSDIAISGKEYFVCDFKGHCVVVFSEEGQFLRRIGGENITNYPNGIDISDAGDILVGDSHGNRFHIAVFQRDTALIGEFECPYVKVSRCCGLKITSEGYVVTLAKNNQHVLVLNTLYIA